MTGGQPSLAQRYLTEETLAAAARVPLSGRWGTQCVYLASVWGELVRVGSPVVAGCQLPDWQQWLCRARRAGLVRLARAPLLVELRAHLLQLSEISDRGGRVWHFLLDPTADPFCS